MAGIISPASRLILSVSGGSLARTALCFGWCGRTAPGESPYPWIWLKPQSRIASKLSKLFPFPYRFALFEERAHALFRVLAGADLIAQLVQILMLDLERGSHHARDRSFHRADRERRVARNLGRPGGRRRAEFGVRHDLMHESHFACPRRIDRVRQIEDFGGVRRADDLDKLAENPVGWQVADPRGRHPEPRARTRDPQVAEERHHETAGQRLAMDRRDRRHRTTAEPMDNLVKRDTTDARLLEVAQVEPGTEAAPFAADNHGADFLVLLDRRERGVEPLGHRAIDRVALFGTVQR